MIYSRQTGGQSLANSKTKTEIAKELIQPQFYTKYKNTLENDCNIRKEVPGIHYREY